MDRLRCIQVFIEVAKGQSFTSAAQRLGMSRASVTKHVGALEVMIGARLLNRSTHHVMPTEAGLSVLEHGAKLLHDFEEIEAEVKQETSHPSGHLRVGVPASYAAYNLVPAIEAFQQQHQGISFTLILDPGDLNLIKDSLDLTLRVAASLKDASHISRLLMHYPQYLVASPDYLKRRGRPTSPADLANHNCLVHTIKSPTGIWRFRHRDGIEAIQVSGTVRANFGEALLHAALGGQGIAMHPTYMIDDDIREGRLEVVLPEVEPLGLELHVIYPQKQNLPRRVRMFIDFLKDWLSKEAKA